MVPQKWKKWEKKTFFCAAIFDNFQTKMFISETTSFNYFSPRILNLLIYCTSDFGKWADALKILIIYFFGDKESQNCLVVGPLLKIHKIVSSWPRGDKSNSEHLHVFRAPGTKELSTKSDIIVVRSPVKHYSLGRYKSSKRGQCDITVHSRHNSLGSISD